MTHTERKLDALKLATSSHRATITLDRFTAQICEWQLKNADKFPVEFVEHAANKLIELEFGDPQ